MAQTNKPLKSKQPVKIKVISCYSGSNDMKQTFENITYEQVKNKLEKTN